MKSNQNSLIEPTQKELEMFKNISDQIDETTMDNLANEYFDLVTKDEIKISFPRFILDKYVRSIKEGDTIEFRTEDKQLIYLFCILRKTINETDYLLFAKADDNGSLNTEETYLFFVYEIDSDGIEILDIIPSGEEADVIINKLEEMIDE